MYICIYTYIYIYIYMNMYVELYIFVYVYVYICTCTYIFMHVQIRGNFHIFIFIIICTSFRNMRWGELLLSNDKNHIRNANTKNHIYNISRVLIIWHTTRQACQKMRCAYVPVWSSDKNTIKCVMFYILYTKNILVFNLTSHTIYTHTHIYTYTHIYTHTYIWHLTL